MDTRQRLTVKKQLHICFSGSRSQRTGSIKWTQKQTTPFLAAMGFCLLYAQIYRNWPQKHVFTGISASGILSFAWLVVYYGQPQPFLPHFQADQSPGNRRICIYLKRSQNGTGILIQIFYHLVLGWYLFWAEIFSSKNPLKTRDFSRGFLKK